jgi:hypothetical protein
MVQVLHRRPDGSFVIAGALGPYHVTASDEIYDLVAAAAEGLDLPPEAIPPAPPAPPPREIAKTRIYRRATDAELAEFEAFLRHQATPRQRLMWEGATGGMVVVEEVRPLAEAIFGAARAAELLAP